MVTGKYTVIGQNATEPSNPRMALKKGSMREMRVVNTTKAVRSTSLHIVKLKDFPFVKGRGSLYTL